MNEELIWDLFRQSGINIGDDQEGNIEKFAELIVRECIAEIANVDLPIVGASFCTTKVANHIADHFGVK